MSDYDYRNVENTDTNIAHKMRMRLEEVKQLSTAQLLEEKAYYEQHEAINEVDNSRYKAILAELQERGNTEKSQ